MALVWPTMAESIAKLYRGVSRAMYDRGDGLKPRGTRAKRGITYGDGHRYDDGSQYGETDDNGVWQHQQGQSPYLDSAWLSTTPHFEMAKKYALYSSVEGVVYEIEPDRFPALGVKMSTVAAVVHFRGDLGNAEDDERSLLATPPGALPLEIVTQVFRVFRTAPTDRTG
jgi:hypothetical protein